MTVALPVERQHRPKLEPIHDPELRRARLRLSAWLRNSHDPEQYRRGQRMQRCGELLSTVVSVRPGEEARVTHGRCGHQLCPVCQRYRAAQKFARMASVIEGDVQAGERLSLLTLTIPHEDGDSLTLNCDVLLRAFTYLTQTARKRLAPDELARLDKKRVRRNAERREREMRAHESLERAEARRDAARTDAGRERAAARVAKLRARIRKSEAARERDHAYSVIAEDGVQAKPYGFRSVIGGGWIRGLEITQTGDHGFHPHLHVLLAAEYWPKRMILELWQHCYAKAIAELAPHWAHRVPEVLDIREMRMDAKRGLSEAVGYPLKVSDGESMGPDAFRELEASLHSRRTVGASKSWSFLARILEEAAEFEANPQRELGKIVNEISADAGLFGEVDPDAYSLNIPMMAVVAVTDEAVMHWPQIVNALADAQCHGLLRLCRSREDQARVRAAELGIEHDCWDGLPPPGSERKARLRERGRV